MSLNRRPVVDTTPLPDDEACVDNSCPAVNPSDATRYVIPTVGIDAGIFHTSQRVNQDTNLEDTIKYMGGSSMYLDKYYSQLTGKDENVKSLDVTLPKSIQAYQSIEGLEVKVQTPLDVTKASDVEGVAIMAVNIIPQQDDMFTYRLANNRRALMRVKDVAKKHYNNNSVYEITYDIDSFLDEDINRYDNIESKVAREYVYDDNYDVTFTAPVITLSGYNVKKKLERELDDLYRNTINISRDNDTHMYMLRYKDYIITDFKLAEAAFKIIPFNYINRHDVLMPYQVNIGLDGCYNVWDSLFDYSENGLYMVDKTNSCQVYSSISDITTTPFLMNAEDLKVLDVDNYRVTKAANHLPDFKEGDMSYMFTIDFYTDDDNEKVLSVLEQATLEYYRGKEIDNDKLLSLVNTYRYWTHFEQFFYNPVLILLIRNAIRKNVNVYI